MAKKGGKRIFNKEEIAEDWCFDCKDGGELMICEYGKCLKAYHRVCVEKDDSDLSHLTSDGTWICGWHRCLVCHEKSDFRCYCCKRASCSRCIGRIDFVHLKGKYGFCNNCLKLALLVEEGRNVDSDGENVDLRDRETYEGLFREYYEIVMEKEGFDKNRLLKRLLAGKAQLDKEKLGLISSTSDKCSEEEDEQLASDNGDFSDGEPPKKRFKKKRSTTKKTRRGSSNKREFVGWGSKPLIDFLQLIGEDTRERLSGHAVSEKVTDYIKEHNLIHPVKETEILCDLHLEALFGKKVLKKQRILSLLKSHFHKDEEQLQNDELHQDLEDDTDLLVSSKTEEKVERKKISSIWCSAAAQSQYAALIPENIKLVYLKKSLVEEMIKQPESIETKIVGSFVRVQLHLGKRNSDHQLVQITGIKLGSSDKYDSESLIQVSNMAREICLTMLSDDEFSKVECDDLGEKVKAGLLKKITIVELEQKAKILHEDITKHRITRELELLQKRIDRANEKGWRHELFQHLERQKLLKQPSYLSFVLQNIPGVIPEEVELESLDRNDNQMHQSADKTTPAKQNIPGVTPEKVELEPLDKDEKDGDQMHQFLDETPPTKRITPGVIPEVELEHLAKDARDGNKMHQCTDETAPTGIVKCEPEDGAPCSGS
ncbi:uncharacterized protein At5g08430-like [Capsicum annuum]|uniref:uncharacterized protein At5g08430-like n=1 Tax=Capsicum annuum TaxID=4072 RepID=UPI001FB0DB16|nr:uncharacterized protein At5g08430-like [Capsicum annuum]